MNNLMTKTAMLLFVSVLFSTVSPADDETDTAYKEITGVRVSYECRLTDARKDFSVSYWAQGCKYPSRRALWNGLLKRSDYYAAPPACTPPKEPLPEPFPPALGEHLDAKVPEGYTPVDETITKTRTLPYPGYNGKSTVYVPIYKTLHGYCYSMTSKFWWKADVYSSVIKAEYFTRRYKKTCTERDKPFPGLAVNERIVFEWDGTEDRSAECTAAPIEGTVQRALISCAEKYRCVKESHPFCPRNEPVGSYVAPTNGTLHEEISLPGTGMRLHYASDRDETNAAFLDKWSLTVRHTLQNGYLLLGTGEKYNLSGISETDEANRTLVRFSGQTFLFDASGRHLETLDSLSGARIYAFEYDENGSLFGVVNAFGETTRISKEGNATLIQAPGGQMTRVESDLFGNVAKILFEDGSAFRFLYDTKGELTEKIDPNGNRFGYLYDENGRVVKTVDPENASWTFAHRSSDTGIETIVTRPLGDTLRYLDRYLHDGVLTGETLYPDARTVTRSVSLDGGRVETLSCGMRSIYLYETDGSRPLTDPWTGEPRLYRQIRQTPSGLTKTIDYTFSYNTNLDGTLTALEQTRTVNNNTYRYVRDFEEHNATFQTPEGRVTRVRFTPDDRLPVRIEASGLLPTLLSYDEHGRLIEKTTESRTYRYRYDEAGNLVETADPLGRRTLYAYDPLGRVTSIVTPSGSEIRFAYDANGNMTMLTTPNDAPYAFAYNGVNRIVKETSPSDAVTRYLYDAQRRLVEVVRPSGKTVEYSYESGRLTTLKTPESETRYDYGCGKLISQISRDSEKAIYEYDGTLMTRVLFEGILDAAVSYDYNDDLLPVSVTYAGASDSYAYDSDGLLSRAGELRISRDFDFRNLTHYEEEGYDRFRILNGYNEPAFSINADYVFAISPGKDGRIRNKIEFTDGTLYTYLYEYDKEGRLAKVYENEKIVESYTYDANGNRIEATLRGKTYTARFTLDDRLEVYGDNTYRYDEDGYLVEKTTPEGTATYTYDTLGALTGVNLPDGTEIRYIQNALGQRAAKEVDGTVVEKYLWKDLTTLLAVYDGEGNVVQRFEYADERVPFAMTMNGDRYHLHYHHLGSLRVVTDMNHTVVKEIVYDSFGNIVEDTDESFPVPFGFAGGLRDRDTGLVHFGFREYDPFTGRWTAKDPIGFAGGDTNLYGYVLNDPVNLVDPSGEYWQIIVGGITLYLAYDNIVDWYDYLKKSAENINKNQEIKTVEDYIDYQNRVKDQLRASCDIGKETTLDVLEAGYPIPKAVDATTGIIYEQSK